MCSSNCSGTPGGRSKLGHVARRFCGQLEAPLDLADLVDVLIDDAAIGRRRDPSAARQLADQRIEDAAALLEPRGTQLRRRAAAEQPLEHHLRIELHRERAVRISGSVDGVGSPIHEIEFVYEQL